MRTEIICNFVFPFWRMHMITNPLARLHCKVFIYHLGNVFHFWGDGGDGWASLDIKCDRI